MAYKGTDPIIVEHTTVNPVVERTTIVESSWYSEPWGIALLLGILVVIGLIAYFVGFNPPATSTVTSNTITREVQTPGPATPSSTPVIVNNPPASSSAATNPPVVINNPPAVINNPPAVAPSTPSAKSGSSSKQSPSNSDNNGDSNFPSSSTDDTPSSGNGTNGSGSNGQ